MKDEFFLFLPPARAAIWLIVGFLRNAGEGKMNASDGGNAKGPGAVNDALKVGFSVVKAKKTGNACTIDKKIERGKNSELGKTIW